MLRTRLLTAAAAVALMSAPAAFAQTPPGQDPVAPPTPTETPATPEATTPAPTPAPAQATAETPAEGNTVIDVLRAQGNYSTLLSALDQAQLTDTLSSRTVTIFAPTDAAFAALPEADRTRLLDPANANELRQLLLYHVVVADVQRSQIQGARGPVQTAANTEVQLDGSGDQLKIDGATIASTDLDASNGAVFSIDQVLMPSNSQVAAGDAETEATPPADTETETATPPAETEAAVTPPPVEADADAAAPVTDEATPPAAEPMMAPAPTPPAATPPADGTVTPPTAETMPTTTPSGETPASVETVASPPVANPTDGQQDAAPDAAQPTPPASTDAAPAAEEEEATEDDPGA